MLLRNPSSYLDVSLWFGQMRIFFKKTSRGISLAKKNPHLLAYIIDATLLLIFKIHCLGGHFIKKIFHMVFMNEVMSLQDGGWVVIIIILSEKKKKLLPFHLNQKAFLIELSNGKGQRSHI